MREDAITPALINPSDPSPDDALAGYTYSFDCGEGYSAWSASNSYPCTIMEDGSQIIYGRIRDKDGGWQSYSRSIVVHNVAPSIDAGSDQTVNQDEAVHIEATFIDPGMQDKHTATIDWGDGTFTFPADVTEPSSPGTVTGSHSYANSGYYLVTVCVADEEESHCDTLLIVVQPFVVDSYSVSTVLDTPEPIAEGRPLIFRITIVNTGDAWLAEVPLRDEFDPEYLEFDHADKLPDTVDTGSGVLEWHDLTTNPDADMAPGESLTVVVTYKALKDTTDPWVPPAGETRNTATVQGALRGSGWSQWSSRGRCPANGQV